MSLPGRRHIAIALLALAPLLAPTGCSTPEDGMDTAAGGVRFVVVRHAEKQSGDDASPDDPGLTSAGHERAGRLARSFDGADLVAVYSTPYRRTRDTAAPTAQAHGLGVVEYDARRPADEFAEALRIAHHSGVVLVVGHSNTVPAIVSALCECEVAAMSEEEYEHRFLVETDANGRVRVLDQPLP